jgi:Tol biopolymer transport system component
MSVDGHRIGYSRFAGDPAAYDVYVYDSNVEQPPRLLGSKIAAPTGSLSFRPTTNELTFEDTQGRVSNVDLKTLRVSPVLVGKRPRWSHDGLRLAFRSEEAVYVYDAARNNSTVTYGRSATDGNFDGSLYWSRNDRFLAFNLNVGVDAPKRRCVMVDTQTGRVAMAVTTPYLCGPFVSATRE